MTLLQVVHHDTCGHVYGLQRLVFRDGVKDGAARREGQRSDSFTVVAQREQSAGFSARVVVVAVRGGGVGVMNR